MGGRSQYRKICNAFCSIMQVHLSRNDWKQQQNSYNKGLINKSKGSICTSLNGRRSSLYSRMDKIYHFLKNIYHFIDLILHIKTFWCAVVGPLCGPPWKCWVQRWLFCIFQPLIYMYITMKISWNLNLDHLPVQCIIYFLLY
jgi:hypothetical protein